jgi:hypothetical protein
MATIRSISPTKPSERLLNRRLPRSSSSVAPLPHKKLTLSKTNPITVATIKRRKSSRMSSKKRTVSHRINSFTTITNLSDNDDLTNKMASTTLDELPPIRQTSVMSDANSTTSAIPIPQISSDTILDNEEIEEPHDDNPISNKMSETRSPSPSPSSSRKSSTENIEFTIDSFDTIRTVGTGKIIKFENN